MISQPALWNRKNRKPDPGFGLEEMNHVIVVADRGHPVRQPARSAHIFQKIVVKKVARGARADRMSAIR
jgi:hypothetical protein